jgi:hypothetical protein
MGQDNISTLSIFVNAQVGGAIKSLESLEKAAATLGPAFERSVRETGQSVDVFDAKLKKIALGFTRGNFGGNVQKQVDQIRGYFTGLQGEMANMQLKDPSFDNAEFKQKLDERTRLLESYQVMLDRFGVADNKAKSTGAPVKNSADDKQARWLAIAQSKQQRANEQAQRDQKAADDQRQTEGMAKEKQQRRIETARRLDDRIGQDYFESGIGTGAGERNRKANERAMAANIAREKQEKQQLRLETARRLDDQIDSDQYASSQRSPSRQRENERAVARRIKEEKDASEAAERRDKEERQQRRLDAARGLDNQIDKDYYNSGLGTNQGERNRRENEKAVADSIAADKQQRRMDAARRLTAQQNEDYSNAGLGSNKSNRVANEAEISRRKQEEDDRGREAGTIDAIRRRQREAAYGIGGSSTNRLGVLSDPLHQLRPGDDPRLNTNLGLAQNEHVVNRATNRPVFAADTERKEVVSNFKVKIQDLDAGQLSKLQGKLQKAIKLTDPADEKRLERYNQLLGQVDKQMMLVQSKAKPLTFANDRDLTKYVRGLTQLEKKLQRAENEGKDVAQSLRTVRNELQAINNTPMKNLVPNGSGNLGGRGKNGLKMGAGSETRNFRFVSQQLAFGADDFMQTYQLGGLKSGMRAMSNNLTAIAGLAIPNPAVAAGAVVGISAMSATLPPLVDWLTALSTGIPNLEKVNFELEKIKNFAKIDAKISILVEREDLTALEAYIKKLKEEAIVLKFETEGLKDRHNEFNAEANKIAGADGDVPGMGTAAYHDVGNVMDSMVAWIAGAMGADSIEAQARKNMEVNESVAGKRRRYLEAQANRDALKPEIDKARKKEDELRGRIERVDPAASNLRKTQESLAREKKTFEMEREQFLNNLKSMNERTKEFINYKAGPSSAIPLPANVGVDGAMLKKVGTPHFQQAPNAQRGNLQGIQLPESVAKFTNRIDAFYARQLQRQEQAIRMNTPNVKQSDVDKQMTQARVDVERDRNEAIKQHEATYKAAEKRIQTEKDVADRMRSSLMSTVDPRRKLEEDFLKRQEGILNNRGISAGERGHLLELSKEKFKQDVENMERLPPKPVNNGIDVGSRADAELKQRLSGYSDTKSLAVQQIIAGHLAAMKAQGMQTNKLLGKLKAAGMTF